MHGGVTGEAGTAGVVDYGAEEYEVRDDGFATSIMDTLICGRHIKVYSEEPSERGRMDGTG